MIFWHIRRKGDMNSIRRRNSHECTASSGASGRPGPLRRDNLDTEVHDACGSDMMSDVLAFVKNQAVLLTGLVNIQVVRTAVDGYGLYRLCPR